jgi:hypothetical protein
LPAGWAPVSARNQKGSSSYILPEINATKSQMRRMSTDLKHLNYLKIEDNASSAEAKCKNLLIPSQSNFVYNSTNLSTKHETAAATQ